MSAMVLKQSILQQQLAQEARVLKAIHAKIVTKLQIIHQTHLDFAQIKMLVMLQQILIPMQRSEQYGKECME
jgi:hypothetical protein